jgi:putative ABC transport system substrate-binding protein
MVVEKRWAENRMDRLPGLMAEVVGNNVDVLVSYSTPAVLAARNATRTVPIVGVGMGDPVGTGLAASLAQPGGNVTGLYMGFADVAQKWLELLQETIPRLSTVVLMSNRDVPVSVRVAKELTAVAPKFRVKIRVLDVPGPEEFDDAFKQARYHAQAVIVLPDPVSLGHRKQVIALAAQYRLPTFYFARDFVEAGGLMAYAADSVAMWRRAAEYVDKILRGAKAAELPIEQPNKFELIVNLKTAKALGITIPQSILLRADDVIR